MLTMRKLKMTKYISNGQLNVEYLTKASLSFEVEEERGKVIFLVANEVQKL